MNLPEDILSERIGQYQRRTQLAIDNERPIAFIGYANPDGSGEGDWVEGTFDSLMAAHRCEHCQGAGWTREAPEPEEGFWLPFVVLLVCAVAFVLWMFWAATAVTP